MPCSSTDSKQFWNSPNCFGLVQIFLDMGQTSLLISEVNILKENHCTFVKNVVGEKLGITLENKVFQNLSYQNNFNKNCASKLLFLIEKNQNVI